MGWETQPLRVQPSRVRPLRLCVLALNIPSILNPANPLILNLLIQTPPTLHSAGVLFLDQSPFYRHYAPLERKAILLPRFPSSFLPSSPLPAPSRLPVLNPENPSILSILIQTTNALRNQPNRDTIFRPALSKGADPP